MAGLLAQLLLGSNLVYKRADCKVMDTSSTSLPAAAATAPTVNGVMLNHGDRALYTALTSGNNNTVYVATESFANGSASWSMTEATDGRKTTGQNPGGPTLYDVMAIDQGSAAGTLQCWNGSAFISMDTL